MEIMENETSHQLRQLKILVAVLFVLVFGAIGYIGWESISGKADDAISRTPQQDRQFTSDSSTQDARVQAIKSALEREHTIEGRVTSITSDSITINTQVVDQSKLADLDYSKSNELPMIERSIKIRLTKETAMPNIPKVGDSVSIDTNESVHKSNTTIAVSVAIAQIPNP